MIYSSNRQFKLWAYSVSHSSLLLRSEMRYFDQFDYSELTNYNIDIEIWAVEYVDLPTHLNELTIMEIIKVNLPEKLISFKDKKDSKVFQITVNQKNYYIVAGGLIVGKNSWEHEDRIFNYNLKLQHDEIIFKM